MKSTRKQETCCFHATVCHKKPGGLAIVLPVAMIRELRRIGVELR
jgi:hypothetical protein